MSSRLKESKSAATIRRRKNRVTADVLFRSKSSHDDETLSDENEESDLHQDEPICGPLILQLIMKSQWTLFLGLLAFRAINALVLQSSYVPDEFWQSLEVAHKMTFGYGYLTWEWKTGLRGYFYPFLISILYKALALLRLDNRILLIKLPRLLQAVFAALGDLYLYKLSRKLSGQKVAIWVLICQLTSWFTFYISTRTLTNSLETQLTTMALYYFPWPGRKRSAMFKYMSLVGLSVVVRPTAAILWTPLCVWHLWLWRHMAWRVTKLFAELGLIILSISSIIDRIFYGKWVNVQYNFLEFNVLHNMGAFYGSHPFHWYLTQGFPVVMATHIFPFLLGVRHALEPVFVAVIGWTVFVFSLLEHKEFRFLYPVMPLAMHLCGKYLCLITEAPVDEDVDEDEEKEEEKTSQSAAITSSTRPKAMWTRKQLLVALLIATNLPLALYTSLLHQRGTVDVMKFVHDEDVTPGNRSMSTLFLMPCHSTPWYSYVHRNVSMRFLTCEPNLDQQLNYIDEADIFFENPLQWLENFTDRIHLNYNDPQNPDYMLTALPSHLILFNVLQFKIDPFLSLYQYEQCAKFFHSHSPEGRVGSHVLVFCQKSWISSQKATRKRMTFQHRMGVR